MSKNANLNYPVPDNVMITVLQSVDDHLSVKNDQAEIQG